MSPTGTLGIGTLSVLFSILLSPIVIPVGAQQIFIELLMKLCALG